MAAATSARATERQTDRTPKEQTAYGKQQQDNVNMTASLTANMLLWERKCVCLCVCVYVFVFLTDISE